MQTLLLLHLFFLMLSSLPLTSLSSSYFPLFLLHHAGAALRRRVLAGQRGGRRDEGLHVSLCPWVFPSINPSGARRGEGLGELPLALSLLPRLHAPRRGATPRGQGLIIECVMVMTRHCCEGDGGDGGGEMVVMVGLCCINSGWGERYVVVWWE